MSAIETFFSRALALECEAVNRYGEFEAWFSDRSLATLAARCRSLATAHLERCSEFGGEHARDPGTPAWIGQEAREVFYQLAGPRQVLEVALDAELEALRYYERISAEPGDGEPRLRAAILAQSAMRCVGEVVAAIDEVSPVDWEAVISLGGGPGLALGAERRVRAASRAG